MAVTGRRISNAMRAPETQPSDVAMVAGQGLWVSRDATHRGDLPALLAGGAAWRPSASRRCRRVVLVAAVLDGVVDWLSRRRTRRRRHQADRPGALPGAQAPRRPGLRCRVVDRCDARTQHRPAQTADPDLTTSDPVEPAPAQRCPRSSVRVAPDRCVAERLSVDPGCRVTVVEAGPGPAVPGVADADR